ncbi:MAG: hypothetical protein H6737_28605 [Alphaproteobacteria bacterium]|nr:hypothetical protein [Alphaproteobacteria bacterium]
MLVLAALLACSERCGPDEVETFDGCSPLGDGPVTDTETLPGYTLRPCNAREGTGLDFETGCAAGVCIGDPIEVWQAVAGAPTSCDPIGTRTYCRWEDDGLAASFDDADDDGQPDPGTVPTFVDVIGLEAGTSPSGLGVDVSFACYVQQLGAPVDIQTEDGKVVELDFETSGAFVHTADYGGQQSVLDADGFVDIILFGTL